MTGHGLPQVADAVSRQARRGITTMLPTADALWVAEELHRRFGLPFWQMAMTATDANRFVLRFAREITGRPKVLVFDWCYHGTVDEALATLDADGRVVARPGSIGPQVDPASTTAVVPFNDVGAVEMALAEGDVACVLAEPALTNIGIVLPAPNYHDALRRLTRETGTLLLIDETHTICAGPGGCTRALDLEPDAVVVGKTIGGGVPAAAYGLSADVAERLRGPLFAEEFDVSGVGGTLTGNAVGAGRRSRPRCRARSPIDEFGRTIPLAGRWTDGVQAAIDAHDLAWTVQQLGCRAEYWFCPAPRDGAEAAAAVYVQLDGFMHLWALNRGILTPFHNMALLSPHHGAGDVDLHTEAFGAAVERLAA